MKQTNNELLRAVRFALYAGTAATVGLTATPAFAQDKPADQGSEKLETIVVTGSRIRRVDLETASPVFVVDKAAIEKTGKLTVGDLLQETPSISGAATNPQVNNGGGTGAATVSLRGLGSARTLLLLNGRRMAFNDVNSIPINMIERIEILKDGASAIYGSDAIGGVVNFITRTDYQGLEASVDYGVSDRDDGERKGVQISMGQSSDRGSLVVGANWHKIDQVNARDRKYAEASLYNYFGSVFPLGSPTIPNGRYVIPKSVSSTFGINSCPGQSGANVQLTRKAGAPGTSKTDFRCYVGSGPGNDTYNFQAVGNTVQTPQERGGLFAIGSYKITDGIEAYVEAFTHKTKSNQEIAPNPLPFATVNLSKDSIYNPFGVNVTSGGLRLEAVGNRASYFRTRFDQLNAGLRGNIGDTSWHWEAGFTFGRVSQFSRTTGHLFNAALKNAVGPSFYDANGVPTCGTPSAPIAGCTPINLFGLENQTAAGRANVAALNAIAADTTANSYATTKGQEINVSGELFELPAGAVSLAAGVSHSKDTSDFLPDFVALITDPEAGTCLTDPDSCQSPSSGALSNKEVYFELLVPVLRDTFLAKSLNVTLGSRYSDYSAFGNTTNSKIGIEWRPIDDLLLRGTVAEVFRAPTISDLYGGVANSADTYNDPCDKLSAANVSNPACAGLTAGFQQNTAQTNTLNGSNDQTQPETGKVFTWGAVYDPNWLEGVSTSVDFWKVTLHDTIGSLGTQVILDQCFNFGRFCNLFTRDTGTGGTGDINFVKNTTQNIGRLDTQGVDFSIKYRLPETSWGNFRLGLDGTYVQKWNSQVIEGDISTQTNMAGAFIDSSKGGDGSYARWRGLGSIAWNLGAFDASWRMRYINGLRYGKTATAGDGYSVVSPVSDNTASPKLNGYKIGAYTYHDVQFGYNMEALNTRVEVGIDNVDDKQPPLFYQYGFNANTDVRTYDTVGRYFWARLGVKF